jgi:hypothetical protein
VKAFRVTLQLGDAPMVRQLVVTGDPDECGIRVGDTCNFDGARWRVALIEPTEILASIQFPKTSAAPAAGRRQQQKKSTKVLRKNKS